MSLSRLSIHELTPDHRDWQEYVDVIDAEGQARWAFDARFERFPRHYVAAKADGCVVGFVMYVVWDIGPYDRNQPPQVVDGQTLTEAKIIALGVKEPYRRQGIGRALQEHVIRRARELGCYEVRSVSDTEHRRTSTSSWRWGSASNRWNATRQHWRSSCRSDELRWSVQRRTTRPASP